MSYIGQLAETSRPICVFIFEGVVWIWSHNISISVTIYLIDKTIKRKYLIFVYVSVYISLRTHNMNKRQFISRPWVCISWITKHDLNTKYDYKCKMNFKGPHFDYSNKNSNCLLLNKCFLLFSNRKSSSKMSKTKARSTNSFACFKTGELLYNNNNFKVV